LSRACLGKMIIVVSKWRQKGVFRTDHVIKPSPAEEISTLI
jgi:hypothetical protein